MDTRIPQLCVVLVVSCGASDEAASSVSDDGSCFPCGDSAADSGLPVSDVTAPSQRHVSEVPSDAGDGLPIADDGASEAASSSPQETGCRAGEDAGGAGSAQSFPLPSAKGHPYPSLVTAGPDCNVWFVVTHDGGDTIDGSLSYITPTGTVKTFPGTRDAISVATGPDGNLWFGSDSSVGRMTPDGTVTRFANGLSAGGSYYIVRGADGYLWFTKFESRKIGRIAVDGAIAEFSLTSAGNSTPRDIAPASDGGAWFTEWDSNSIGRITSTGAVSEVDAECVPLTIALGPDGNAWYACADAEAIVRLTSAGVQTRYPTGVAFTPIEMVTGRDRKLWLVARGGLSDPGVIVRFEPDGSQTSSINIGSVHETWTGVTVGPDGNIWLSGFDPYGQGFTRFVP